MTIQCTNKWLKHFGVEYLLPEHYNSMHNNTQQDTHNDDVESYKTHKVTNMFATIDELKSAVMNLEHPLKDGAKNTVFSSGPIGAPIMMIGEAPGAEEDERGVPFVGDSGRLVNNILKSIGIQRDDVYVTNVVFWRPPQNRVPLPDEIEFCRPYFMEHIRLAKPKIIILLGAVATRAVLRTTTGITSIRGTVQKVGNINAVPTFHPSYLMRSPLKKYNAMLDFNLCKNITNS